MDHGILTTCFACGGQGFIEHDETRRFDLEPRFRAERCATCDGEGQIEAEAYPVECADLTPLVPA